MPAWRSSSQSHLNLKARLQGVGAGPLMRLTRTWLAQTSVQQHSAPVSDLGGMRDRLPAHARLLHALNERLKEDAAQREATSKAEITITREGLPPSMRTVPPAAQEGAAPAA